MNISNIRIQNFLWLLPFLCFLIGYQFIRFFYLTENIVMPRLVGKNLQEVVKVLSDNNLNLRILEERQTTEVPKGTVLSQIPLEGQIVKPFQSIFLVLSQYSTNNLTPIIQGLFKDEALKLIQESNLESKFYNLSSNYPLDLCIAQIPGKNLRLNNKKIIGYISSGAQSLRIMPNLQDKPLDEVLDFLHDYSIEPKVFHGYEIEDSHSCENCKILDQRPAAGKLVNLSNPFKIQLRIG